MNLILSDVEETIMLVDGADGAAHGQGAVNVSSGPPSRCDLRSDAVFRWQKGRWKCFSSEAMGLFWYVLRLPMRMCLSFPNFLRYHLLHGPDPCQETSLFLCAVRVHFPVFVM